jgi:peptide/nickel transport system substrate-binding protein
MNEYFMKITRALAIFVVAVLAVSALPSALGSAPTAESAAAAAAPATEVKVGWLSAVVVWNPMNVEMVEDYVAMYLMFGVLFTYDEDLNGPVNDLVTDYTQVVNGDGTMTTTMTITANAYFRNAANPTDTTHPLTAYDVEYTFERIIANPGGAWDGYLGGITDISVTDDTTVVFTTAYPKATLLDDISGIPIIPQYQWVDISDNKFLSAKAPEWLIGSGPFYFESEQTGAWVRFARAPNYYGAADYPGVREVAYVESILITTYTTASAMVIAMNSGTEDVVVLTGEPNLYKSSLGVGSAVPIIKYATQDPGICDIAINAIPIVNRTQTYGQGNPILLDPIVREAISMTLNRDHILTNIMQGLATAADSVIQPNYWHTTPTPARVYDPAGAMDLLMANGYEDADPADGVLECTATAYPVEQGWADVGDPLFFEIHAPNTDPSWGSIAQNWVTWGALAGIEFEASILSETVMINNDWYKAAYDIWVWHWGWAPEPLGNLQVWLWEEMQPGGDNCQMPMGPNPGDYDAVWREAQKTLVKEDRKVLVDLLQQWVYDSDCEIPPYYDVGLYGLTEARWLGWGNWSQHIGLAAPGSDMIWLWFQLEPNTANQNPLFTEDLADSYTAVVDTVFSVDVSFYDADDDTLTVNWSWGDGSAPEQQAYTTGTAAGITHTLTHTYATANLAGYALDLSIWDGQAGHQVNDSSLVIVSEAPNAPPQFVTAVNHVPASPVYVGDTVNWNVTAVDDDATMLKFTWDWGDGTSTVSPHDPVVPGTDTLDEATHAWDFEGSYDVVVSVWDGFALESDPSHNLSSAAVTYVVLVNQPPEIPTISSMTGIRADPIECVAMSTDPDGDALTFTWDFGGGDMMVTHHAATGPGEPVYSMVTYTWATAGTYPVTVYVDDEVAGNVSATADAVILGPGSDVPPSGQMLTADPAAPMTDAVVTFNASAVDGNGDPLSIWIEFGDGTSSSATGQGGTDRQWAEFDHAYAAENTYTVTAWFDDGTGNVSAAIDVTVTANAAPLLSLPPTIGAQYNVSVSVVPTTCEDPDGDPLTVWYDWGDGSAWTMGDPLDGYSSSHVYSVVGTQTLTVYADDGVGHNVSDTATVSITEANIKPTVSLTKSPDQASYLPGTEITFTITVTDYEGDYLTVVINFGEGTPQTITMAPEPQVAKSQNVTHTFNTARAVAYVVSVSVSDGFDHPGGNNATDSIDVLVAEEEGGEAEDNTLLYAAIAAIVIIAALLAVFFLMKRKKGPEAASKPEGGMEGSAPPEEPPKP